uniref:Uncharacterized protein n=1 Tax=Musa acuminata subsp. malaccensis TaxID=214687 RepID=A0A804IYP9_MUSAM
MGGCNSCYAAAVVVDGTAKVVLPDGGLREYTRPVTAAHALGKDAACFFVCDADAMEFDAFVSAVGAEEELRPGQLYFVLPRTMLKYPLRAEDVAALALKASDALMGAVGRGAPGPLVFPLEQEDATGGERREGGFGVIVLVVGVAVLCSAVHKRAPHIGFVGTMWTVRRRAGRDGRSRFSWCRSTLRRQRCFLPENKTTTFHGLLHMEEG